MAVKTITVTEKAYEALKGKKESKESFSETILRITGRRPLRDFYGILNGESGERLEKNIMELRKRRNEAHQKRMKYITEAFRK